MKNLLLRGAKEWRIPAFRATPSSAVAAWLLVAYGALILLQVVHELLADMHSDAAVFLTIGRGILNGRIPYFDLFDFKPPGIFLLSAASLHMTGNFAGVLGLSASIAVALPALASFKAREKLWSFAFGTATAIFILRSGGNFLVESFPAFLVCVYVLFLQKRSLLRQFLGGVCVGLAVLFKEPFALSAFAATLLLFANPKTAIQRSFWPAIISIVSWSGVMLMTRYWQPYISTYWPYTFAARVTESPWLAGLQVFKLFNSFWNFSPVFAAIFFTLSIETILFRKARVLQLILALYVTTVAAGMAAHSSFAGNHCLVAAAPMLAMFLRSNLTRLTQVLLVVLPLSVGFPSLEYSDHWSAARDAAAIVDQVIEDCDVRGFAHLGTFGGTRVLAFMRNSPMGPTFFISDYTARVAPLAAAMESTVKRADLLLFKRVSDVMGSEYQVYERLRHDVTSQFTTQPWGCVHENLLTDDFALLYRKDAR